MRGRLPAGDALRFGALHVPDDSLVLLLRPAAGEQRAKALSALFRGSLSGGLSRLLTLVRVVVLGRKWGLGLVLGGKWSF